MKQEKKMKTKKLTKEQRVIITGFTGVLCCNWDDFHKDVEKRLGRPLFSHEFGFNKEEIKKLYQEDFNKLI